MSDGEQLRDALLKCNSILDSLSEQRREFDEVREKVAELRALADRVEAQISDAEMTCDLRVAEGCGMAQIVAGLIR